MDFRITSLILLLRISDSLTLEPIFVNCNNICVQRQSTVWLRCTYDNIHNKTAFWFSKKQSKNWRKNNEPEDLTLDSDYSGRVKQTVSKYEAELMISDVRESDSGEYQLVFEDDGVKHLSSAAVNLTVTDLGVRISPAYKYSRNETELICEDSRDLTPTDQNYYWYKDNVRLSEARSRSIKVSPAAAGSYSCSHTLGLTNSSPPVCVFQTLEESVLWWAQQ